MSDDLFALPAPAAITTPPRSRCSKGWSRSAAGRACISAAPTSGRCTISPPKCSTMRWTRRWPATPPGSRSRSRRGNRLTITDNGRGMPVDEHPKYPGKSALEVILTTLHSGGKFSDKAYATAGGLHGVGVSVVNALSSETVVEVARNKTLYRQSFSRGDADVGAERDRRRRRTGAARPSASSPIRRFSARRRSSSRRGSTGWRAPRPICSPASRYAGAATPSLASATTCPAEAVFQFPGGLADHLREQIGERESATNQPFTGRQDFPNGQGRVEWAVAWPVWGDGDASYYCNTIPTPDGGTHEQGLRAGADPRHARLRRADRAEEGEGHPGRGRGHRRRDHALASSSAIRSSRARPRTG